MPKQNDLPSPVTYNQKFYAKAAGMDVDLPEAITPEQKYLQAIAERCESIGNIGDVEIDNPENGEVMKYDAEQGKWINGTASGGGGTSDYTDLTNKPKINNVTLAGNKSLSDIGAAAADETYTDAEVDALLSEKADADDVYTIAQADTELAKKVDKVDGKGLSTNDFTDAYKAAVDAAAPKSTTYTKDEVDTALSGKQPTLTTAQLNAVNSGITASIVNKTSALINGLYIVASVAGRNGNQSLEYAVKRSDFNTMSGSGADYTGTYLIHCIEWASEGKPYIGLITFSGGQYSKLTKTDVVTGFAPTITIDGSKFTISGAARISVYALR